MTETFDIWKLLAGLGIFLFGMFLLEESLGKLAGRSFKQIIRKSTSGRMRSVLTGALATSILQSSSAVSLMTLAFVGAGILSMENAIGVILGSNIGTTFTAWIVAFFGFKLDIESFALPLIGIGGLGIIFLGKSERYSNLSKMIVALGFVFMGLDYMKKSVEFLTQEFNLGEFNHYPLLFFLLIGILLTAVVQSSTATLAISLSALYAGILNFDAAAAIVIGANIGTTITIWLGSLGGSRLKKRVAFSHFAFNTLTGIIALIILPLLSYFIVEFLGLKKDPVIALALFHSIFNVLGVLLFLPFVGAFSNTLNRLYPDIKSTVSKYIQNVSADIPEAALEAMKLEVLALCKKTLVHNLYLLQIDERLVFPEGSEPGDTQKKKAKEQYLDLKQLQADIFTFAGQIQEEELTTEESTKIQRYLHAARSALYSAKTLKDIRHNIEDFESTDNPFLYQQGKRFRKRLIETCLTIEKGISNGKNENKITEYLKVLKDLEEKDRIFVKESSEAIQMKKIGDIDVSTALLVNRSFVQSSRQILSALREIHFSEEELEDFENYREISSSLEND